MKESNFGYIDSIEPAGFVDGPGIRMVVFFTGCNLRCIFCHNPETWIMAKGNKITTEEIISKLKRNLTYYQNGGITLSGGEPLLQDKFIIELLKEVKKLGIHTALDTAGSGIGNYEEILKHVDLVILDIKAYTDIDYLKITGKPIDEFNKFMKVCQELKKPLWIRQVIIPGINDNKEYIYGLKEYLSKYKYIERIELLPYHDLGVAKYKKLGISYPLEGVKPLSINTLNYLKSIIKEKP